MKKYERQYLGIAEVLADVRPTRDTDTIEKVYIKLNNVYIDITKCIKTKAQWKEIWRGLGYFTD